MRTLLRALAAAAVGGVGAACLSVADIGDLDLQGSALVAEPANLPAVSADGNQPAAELTAQLTQEGGAPLPGLTVSFAAPGCQVVQPSAPTDALGVATGWLRCEDVGQKVVTMAVDTPAGWVTTSLTTQVAFFAPADGKNLLPPATPLNVAAFARLPDGTVDTHLVGELRVASSDPAAVLPPPVTLAASDGGTHLWLQGALLVTPGLQTVQVLADEGETVLREEAFEVGGDSVFHLTLTTGALPATVGAPLAVTVDARGADGALLENFLGTVRLASSDAAAKLPPPYRLERIDGGTLTTQVTFGEVGPQSLEVFGVDVSVAAARIDGIPVVPGPAATLTLAAPAGASAGVPVDAVVTTLDALGNPTPSFADAVAFSSSDARAVLPAAQQVASDGNGQIYFPGGVTFNTSGPQRLDVAVPSAPALGGAEVAVEVAAVAATTLEVVAPASAVAGVPVDVTLTARGAGGALATDYVGTVGLLAPLDPHATLAAPLTFDAVMRGQLTVVGAAAFTLAASQVLLATDLLQASLGGTSAPIVVAPAPAVALRASVPPPVRSLQPFDVLVDAVDAFGNVQPGYTGQVALSSDVDPADIVPGSITLTPNATFDAQAQGHLHLVGAGSIGPAGASTLTVADASGAFASCLIPLTCAPGPISASLIDARSFSPNDPWATPVGPLGFSIALFDAWGNAVNDYTATAGIDFGGLPGATYSRLLPFTPQDGGRGRVTATLAASGHVIITCSLPPALPGDPPVALSQPLAVVAPATTAAAFDGLLPSGAVPATEPALAVDARGLPTVAWNYAGNGSQIFLTTFDGQAWNQLGTSASSAGLSNMSGLNDQPSLAIDPGTNQPVVAWRSAVLSGVSGAVMVRAWSAAARAWVPLGRSDQPTGITGLTGTPHATPSLAFSGGQPLCAYAVVVQSIWQIAALAFSGGSWVPLGNQAQISSGLVDSTSPSLAVDGRGRPWVAWSTALAAGGQIYLRTFDGQAWVGVGGSDVGTGISASLGGATAPRLAIDASLRPWVVWQDTGAAAALGVAPFAQILVARLDGGAWAGVAGSASPFGISRNRFDACIPDIVIDVNDSPVVVWRQYDYSPNRDGVLAVTPHLARLAGAAWQLLDSALGDVGSGLAMIDSNVGELAPRLAALPDGRVAIAFVVRPHNLFADALIRVASWP